MKRTFKGSLITLGTMFLTIAILFGVLVATPEDTLFYNMLTGIMVAGICSSPLVMLVTIVSGIATLADRLQNGSKTKRKNDDFYTNFNESDMDIDDIMRRLTPEQQAYLQQRLHNNRLGVGSDGELVSMNDLLNDFDQEQSQM
ncbi:MAG: hypothetical protein WBC91_21015 [Phototrophicaceae bacterium]